MNTKGKVLIAAPVHIVLTEGLEKEGYTLVVAEKISQQQGFELIKDCVGVVTSTRLQLDKTLLDAAPQLQWIARMGSGMEVIDMNYAAEKKINCFSSPEGNSNAVAEHAMGMLLSLTKKIVTSYNEVKEGQWLRDKNRGIEIEGNTVGIIGFGHTGRAFARKLSSFDVNILAYDKYPQTNVPSHVQICKDLTPIFEQADIISFHVPLQKDTVHYLDDKFITNMSKAFILINTSRGIVTDTKALLKAVKDGKIQGACLDVWEEEPLEKMSHEIKELLYEALKYPQIIITPHIAGYSMEALFKMSNILLERIIKHNK